MLACPGQYLSPLRDSAGPRIPRLIRLKGNFAEARPRAQFVSLLDDAVFADKTWTIHYIGLMRRVINCVTRRISSPPPRQSVYYANAYYTYIYKSAAAAIVSRQIYYVNVIDTFGNYLRMKKIQTSLRNMRVYILKK